MANLIKITPPQATKTADLKPVAASFNQLLTATMISRLVLNLRNVGYQDQVTMLPLSQDMRFSPATGDGQPASEWDVELVPRRAAGGGGGGGVIMLGDRRGSTYPMKKSNNHV